MDFKTRYKYNPRTDLLGNGGFAIVYRAKDTLLERTVALKFFKNVNDGKHTLVEETKRAIRLEHANLCRYYDVVLLQSENVHGETENTEVGIMEYLDGGHIKTFLSANPEHLGKLLTDVLQGLEVLHETGIIHRDLKPANILVKLTQRGPVAKITDFGISKDINSGNTNSSQLVGSIEYMAPEQFNPRKYGINGKLATNLDLWSFGTLMYELCTGNSLFGKRDGDNSVEQIMANILNFELANDKIRQVAEPYQTLLKMCLVKHAGERVQTADKLIAILQKKDQPIATFNHSDTVFNHSDTIPLHLQTETGSSPTQYLQHLKSAAQLTPGARSKPTAPSAPAGQKNTKYVITAIVVAVIVGLAFFLVNKHSEYQASERAKAVADSIKTVAAQVAQWNKTGIEYEGQKNFSTAATWYKKSADAGDAEGQCRLGLLYENGNGVTQDKSQAYSLISKSAAQGYAKGENNLGRCYHFGIGVPRDYDKAIDWYKKAANGGYSAAMGNIGKMYRDAEGVTQDHKQAVYWFKRGTDAGSALCQFYLAYAYSMGQGVEQNYEQALHWYRKADAQGTPMSANNIGVLFQNGQGVEKNLDSARVWYKKACDEGVTLGCNNLKTLPN